METKYSFHSKKVKFQNRKRDMKWQKRTKEILLEASNKGEGGGEARVERETHII